MNDDGFAFIVPALRAELPDDVGTFFQVRSLAGREPFWILEYVHGQLTLMVAVSADAPLADVRYGERSVAGEWWLCGPAHFRSRRMQLIHACDVSPTRAAIVALVERFLTGSL
ncbi:hypothetical protein [Pandoraea sp. PE-S2T-3]|uniref:hypothetical protein n=1 Tax=Pandoraea sp. PE-S2T-3 TaxID=1986993 RepID=UPI000B3FC444|nr:hypothetical protein [Pandoraea sp. PE-S2T-3]